MRSFKWQALFAAAIVAVPSLALAQSDDNQNQNQNDPFYAAQDAKPRMQVRGAKPDDGRPEVRFDGKRATYTVRAGRVTDGAGIALGSVPPAMAAQLRLQPGVGVVVEQLAPGSPIESAGIEQYDVIEKVDGRPIRAPQQLSQAMRDGKSDSVSLDIIRQAHRQNLHLDRHQLIEGKGFSFTGGGGAGYGGGGMAFQYDPRNPKSEQNDADQQRDKADRERDQADRARSRELERAQRDRDRQLAKRDSENSQREQLNAIREQIKSQLDRERGELDRAREQLNRATQEMNQRLTELRVKLDTEVRQKLEAELRKGQDTLREKMELLEQQTRDLKSDDSKDREKQ